MAIPGHFKQGTRAPLLCFMNKKNTVILTLSSQFLQHQKAAKPNQTKPLNLKKLIPNTKWSLLTVMLRLEGEKSTLPAETVRIPSLMATLQPR